MLTTVTTKTLQVWMRMRMRTQVRAPPLITRHFGVTTQITGCWRDKLESARRAEEEESEGTKADEERKTGRTDTFVLLSGSSQRACDVTSRFRVPAPTVRGLLVQEIAPCWTQRDEGRSGHVLPLVSAVSLI